MPKKKEGMTGIRCEIPTLEYEEFIAIASKVYGTKQCVTPCLTALVRRFIAENNGSASTTQQATVRASSKKNKATTITPLLSSSGREEYAIALIRMFASSNEYLDVVQDAISAGFPELSRRFEELLHKAGCTVINEKLFDKTGS